MTKLQPKLQTCSQSIQEIHLGHLAGLDAVDVWFHRLVVGVAGPFHHDFGHFASHTDVAALQTIGPKLE